MSDNTPDGTLGYQVLVCNISWDEKLSKNAHNKNNNEELPKEMSLNIPENVLTQAKKNNNDFNDIIETFVYNLLYRKFGHEVNRCQIFLPSEDSSFEY